jgi:hypothetical protein
MKPKLRPLRALVLLLLLSGGLAPSSAQIAEHELALSSQLVDALNHRNYTVALEILHYYGVTNITLEAMAGRLGRPPQRRTLAEPFVSGFLLGDPAEGHKVHRRVRDAVAIGYLQPLWVVEDLNRWDWRERAYKSWNQNLVVPIGVMNIRRPDQVIRCFKWYHQYADRLHSVGLNWYHVNNFDAPDHAEAYRLLNALFQLVKARNPDAFVWLFVEPTIDNSDLRWLETMRFPYDGLLVGNLRNFTSRFESTRQRYLPYVEKDTPMVLTGFYGYEKPLVQAGALRRGKRREAAMRAAGEVIAPQLDRHAERVWKLGYRGLILDWRVVEAVAIAQGVSAE